MANHGDVDTEAPSITKYQHEQKYDRRMFSQIHNPKSKTQNGVKA